MSGISSIALTCAPIIAANAVFSARRMDRGFEALADNPLYGAMNLDIAAGQTLKGGKAAVTLASASSKEAAQTIHGASQAIKTASNGSKLVNGLSKVVNFTADYINPIICVTSGVKVLNSENKVDAAADEVIKVGTMFAGEGAYKVLAGMPKYVRENGKLVSKSVESVLYRDVKWVRALVDNFTKYCNEKVLFGKLPLTFLPGALKGLGMAAVSISCYNLGAWISKKLGINQDTNKNKTEMACA